ncbi:SRPBCC family protein [Nonomuraea sp. N2-4H]|uniref:SRPBCC family protein n=1 Tax=Nonomuraea sp. N2-4H TaxID=3128898 RepID=UPI00324D223E
MAMRFEHEFTVPVPIEQAWAVLLDVERVAPCLPGATLDTFEGDEFTGRMKVKVGPITVTYRGTARFEDVDKDSYSLTIQASGKEARGTGTASATVKARMRARGESTLVTVETSFNVTGRPAQFGRGVMAEVGGKLIERFAANLAELLSEPTVEQVEPAAAVRWRAARGGAAPERGPRNLAGGGTAGGTGGCTAGGRGVGTGTAGRLAALVPHARRGGARPAGDRRAAAAQARPADRGRGGRAPCHHLGDSPDNAVILGK